jgi:hypothetical protein
MVHDFYHNRIRTCYTVFSTPLHFISIVTDLTFLLFILLVLSNFLRQCLCYQIWWTPKYSVILFACGAGSMLVQKGNLVFLVTAIIGCVLSAVNLLFP